MVSFLVLYGTGEGQTAKVAARIADGLAERGHDAVTVDAGEGTDGIDLDDVDAVVVGTSIHYGRSKRSVRRFVAANAERLAAMPTAFFQLSLADASDEGAEQAAAYVAAFVDGTGWQPDRVGRFGGALRYSKYGFLTRLLMRQIATRRLPDADPSADTEFTDWDEVDAFTADVAAFVEGRLGVVPPTVDEAADGP
jgi:menaquinone-dependent protoporphyrinogen oxidase